MYKISFLLLFLVTTYAQASKVSLPIILELNKELNVSAQNLDNKATEIESSLVKLYDKSSITTNEIFKFAFKNKESWIVQYWLKGMPHKSELYNMYLVVEMERLRSNLENGDLSSILEMRLLSNQDPYLKQQLSKIKKENFYKFSKFDKIIIQYREALVLGKKYFNGKISEVKLRRYSDNNIFINKILPKKVTPTYKRLPITNPQLKPTIQVIPELKGSTFVQPPPAILPPKVLINPLKTPKSTPVSIKATQTTQTVIEIIRFKNQAVIEVIEEI